MIIKRAGADTSQLVKKLFTRRWLALIVGCCLFCAVILSSIYYGMQLVKTGKSMTMNAWVSGLAKAKFSVFPNFLDGLTATPERIEIDIAFKEYQKLAYKRQQALTMGHLVSEDEDWVPAKIRYKGDTYKVELRLKGDVSDHWRRADRWSYKIKVKGDHTLFGMKRFAIQDPQTREYMNEWVIHRLQREMGLISLRYDFIDVTVNGKHQPICALEENFEKRLIENNNRREGPILRYDSWFYWLGREGLEPELAGSSVSTYQEGRYTGDSELSRLFEIGRSLLEQYRRGQLPAAEVFDLQRMASFFAVSDLTGYYHATHIDNLKFYYNPVTSLIEPIGYDFNEILPLSRDSRTLGEQLLPTINSRDAMDWRTGLFLDNNFYLFYVEALKRISEERFLDEFFEKNREDYKHALAVLHMSYPWYNFLGESVLRRNQGYIRRLLDPVRSIQVYRDHLDTLTSALTISVQNIYALPAEVVSLKVDSIEFPLPTPVVVSAYSEGNPIRFEDISFDLMPETMSEIMESKEKVRIVYRIYGTTDNREEMLYPWPAANESMLAGDFLRQSCNADSFDFLAIDNGSKTITIKPGEWELRTSLILPPGYTIRASEGVILDLLNESLILSSSPLHWRGSEEYPIRIQSSDSSGQGVIVLAANALSELSWVEFFNLGNPSKGAWLLTGAVTFYESPVEIENCRFANNHCEDGLNTIRTEFSISKTWFVQTQADAFDADFCTGSFDQVNFVECGNDGIDVSGSTITISNIVIDGAGDKGLSAGENSQMTVTNTTIRNAEIAIASKDRSKMEIEDLTLINSRVAFAAYQKKPEFAPGEIIAKGVEISGGESAYLIEQGSTLIIDGKIIPPSRKDVKEILYGVEYGKSSK